MTLSPFSIGWSQFKHLESMVEGEIHSFTYCRFNALYYSYYPKYSYQNYSNSSFPTFLFTSWAAPSTLLIFPHHRFKIKSYLFMTRRSSCLHFYVSPAPPPKPSSVPPLLSKSFTFPSLHLVPHFPSLYLYEAVPVCDQRHNVLEFFPPSVRSSETSETKARQ